MDPSPARSAGSSVDPLPATIVAVKKPAAPREFNRTPATSLLPTRHRPRSFPSGARKPDSQSFTCAFVPMKASYASYEKDEFGHFSGRTRCRHGPRGQDVGVDDTSSNEPTHLLLSAHDCVFGFVAELMKPEGRTRIADGKPKFKGRKSPKAPNHHV